MKLQKFDGGLSTRLSPQFINQDQGVIYNNIDNSKGCLVPAKNKTPTTQSALAFNWYSNALNRWFSNNNYTTYVEYNSIVYEAGSNIQQVHTSNSTFAMGITAPGSLTVASVLPSSPVTDATVSSTIGGGNLPNQDITYLLINDSAGTFSTTFEITHTASSIPQSSASINILGNKFTKAGLRKPTAAADTLLKSITISKPKTALLGSNGIRVFRQYKDVWRQVGILATEADTLVDAVEDISANIELDTTKYSPLVGIYQYVMTYYDSNRGRESGPSPVSAEFDLQDSGYLQLDSLPVSTNPTVNQKKIYRVGGELTNFALVATISNSTTSFLDNLADFQIPGDILNTQIVLPAPTGLSYLVTANAMLFGALGSKLRYTPIDQPESWPELYFITFESTITSLAAVAAGILVCTINQTFLVSGSGPNSLSVAPISTDQGCINHKSMQVLKGSALWVSQEGICTSSGDLVNVISRNSLGALNISVLDSELVNEVYYVLASNGTTYSFDTAIGQIFKTYTFAVSSLAKRNSVLYGYDNGTLFTLLTATNNLEMHFKSAWFVEGSFTLSKQYKHIYIFSKGDIIVKVYINDVLVATEQLDTSLDNHQISVPQELLRGAFLQLEIIGTGEVYEIEYEVGTG